MILEAFSLFQVSNVSATTLTMLVSQLSRVRDGLEANNN